MSPIGLFWTSNVNLEYKSVPSSLCRPNIQGAMFVRWIPRCAMPCTDVQCRAMLWNVVQCCALLCCEDSSLFCTVHCCALQCASQLSISFWQLDALLTHPTDPLLPVQPCFSTEFLLGCATTNRHVFSSCHILDPI